MKPAKPIGRHAKSAKSTREKSQFPSKANYAPKNKSFVRREEPSRTFQTSRGLTAGSSETADVSHAKVRMLKVTDHNEGQRLDNYLLAQLKGVPKSRIYRIVRKGEVRVNKGRAKPDYRLQVGDEVRIPPIRTAQPNQPPQASDRVKNLLQERVLYEDKNLLIINKPSGMAVHGGSGIDLGIIEALRQFQPHDTFLELVHRLDKDTSGCLIIAKKPSILKQLHEMMRREGVVVKLYQALVKGYWPKKTVFVDASLRKFELKSGERMVEVSSEGKSALTEFKVLQRFSNATLVEARLHTGRTHQIRVHATHVGHPVVGDEKYGDKDFNKEMREFGCKRLFLHATSISFKLQDVQISVEAKLDPDLVTCLSQLS